MAAAALVRDGPVCEPAGSPSEGPTDMDESPDIPVQRGACEACSGTGLTFSRIPVIDRTGHGRYLQPCPLCDGSGRRRSGGDTPGARV